MNSEEQFLSSPTYRQMNKTILEYEKTLNDLAALKPRAPSPDIPGPRIPSFPDQLAESLLYHDLLKKYGRLCERISVLEADNDRINSRVFEGAPIINIRPDIRTAGLKRFLLEWCELGPEHRVYIGDLYSAWGVFCMMEDFPPPITSGSFGKQLLKATEGIRAMQVRDENGKMPRAYIGIRLRPTCPFLT